jgi:DNA-binding HxlR family transcriptional regulator
MLATHPLAEDRPCSRRRERRLATMEDLEMIARIRAVLHFLDDPWAVDIILLMASGVQRPASLRENVPGLSKKALTATLRSLENHGIVVRSVYSEIPLRIEYRLGLLGSRLAGLLVQLDEWSREHAPTSPGGAVAHFTAA